MELLLDVGDFVMDGCSQMSLSAEFCAIEFFCLLENKQTALSYCFLNEGNANKVV